MQPPQMIRILLNVSEQALNGFPSNAIAGTNILMVVFLMYCIIGDLQLLLQRKIVQLSLLVSLPLVLIVCVVSMNDVLEISLVPMDVLV